MNSAYLETVRPLTQVAPFVFVDVSDVNYFGRPE